MDFDATLQLDGKTATGVTVPSEIIESLGAGKRTAVLVTINVHCFPTTIGSMKGVFKIPVSAERRGLISAEAGDILRVSVVLDEDPAEIEVPSDLAEALSSDQASAEFIAGLTASQRKGFIVPIEDAKTAGTRQRRVEKAVSALKARQKRP
ncbi:MAG: YdeI/OmpD-associated family protein [Acidimicrobiales bacterium]